MNRKLLVSCLLLQCLCTPPTWSYIEGIKVMTLKDGRQIMLMFDAYKGYSVADNELQAFTIAGGVKNLALNNPQQRIDLSYEDSGIYDVDSIIPQLDMVAQACQQLPQNHSLALVARSQGGEDLDAMAFKKPEGFTSFLGGDFTLALAVLNNSSVVPWPPNLRIRSNDPRQEHYLALTNDQEWLIKNGDTIKLKDLVTPAWNLRNKQFYFAKDPSLTPELSRKLDEKIQALRESVQEQMQALANYISMKTEKDFELIDLDQSITLAQDSMDLSLVHEFLWQNKQKVDVYAETPIVDLLLTIFAQDAPDFYVVILGNLNATKFERELNELGVVAETADLVDVSKTIADMFMGI